MATLVVLQSGEAVPHELAGDLAVLGRHPECDIQLHSNMVSRKHAQIVRDGGGYFVEDLGSGNGTFVNGKRINERTPLGHEDRIKLGPILLRFESEASADGSGPRKKLPPDTFKVDIASGDRDSATIMGEVENPSGFGILDVRPEAKLKGIIEIARSLAGTVDLKDLLPRVLDTLFHIFPHADRGCVLLRHPESGEMVAAAQKHRRSDEDESVRISRTVLSKVLEAKSGILSADAAEDSRFSAAESISNLSIRSIMCVPLLDLDGEPMGVINIDTQNPVNQFKKDDLELLMAVAGQASLCYENARLLVSHMEMLKRDNEMAIARRVQHALLPKDLPKVAGYQFFASYDAAQEVGGDYYDSFLLPDNRICLAFGDVAGKGVPGALLMSRISSCVQTIVPHVPDVGRAIRAINNHMCAGMAEGRFVTFVLVIIDLNTHEMSLVNAGHMTPLIRGPNSHVEEFGEDATGIPIGIMDGFPYETVQRVLEPGETVVIITDGVDEAMDPD
ncbi:MAG: SpoIIE family protein phosphatase, partial [Planctomycetaceae bacterium]